MNKNKAKKNIKLGVRARDKVTGFEGIIIGKSKFLFGCDQYIIAPKVDKDGKCGDANYFDEGRIEIIDAGITAKEVKGKKPGGPNRDAPRTY